MRGISLLTRGAGKEFSELTVAGDEKRVMVPPSDHPAAAAPERGREKKSVPD
jgi:hypothetical protein